MRKRNRADTRPTNPPAKPFLPLTPQAKSEPAFDGVNRHIIIAISLTALAVVFWTVADVFIITFGAVVVGTVIHTLTAFVGRITKLSHRVSLGIVLVTGIVAIGLGAWLFGSRASEQIAQMREQLPAAADKFRAWLAESQFGQELVDTLSRATEDGGVISNAGLAAGAALTGIGHILLIVFAGIYLAADPALYREGALRLLPPARRPQVRRALNDAGESLRKWLVAQFIVMAAVGILTGVGLALLGVPLSLSLGLLVGLLEFVPVLGPIAAAIPGVLLAFAIGMDVAMYTVLLYFGVQQLESNVLTPLIQRWAVELPPVVALLSIVVCGVLFGLMGVLFATPIAVTVMALVRHLYVEDTLEHERSAGIPIARKKRAPAQPA